MTWIDRFVQTRRIKMAARYLPKHPRVLDVGCADGALFRVLPFLRDGVGIDPEMSPVSTGNAQLIRGMFPQDLPHDGPFDAITMLAVLEHIPKERQPILAHDCFRYLRSSGRLIITVPSPQTDYILNVLRALRLIDGMSLEQHYGYDVNLTPQLFESAGFKLLVARKFQLGLNNLFVFEKP
ncbi:MAG TPA: methyltransferase domain-containing protein [Bryobacteraceae bacterium]|nr:methyltransferase domain-containing protein [Bryobacteraceae bacterium]